MSWRLDVFLPDQGPHDLRSTSVDVSAGLGRDRRRAGGGVRSTNGRTGFRLRRGCRGLRVRDWWRDTVAVTSRAASYDERGSEVTLRAQQAVARSAELTVRASLANDVARRRTDRARAEAAAAHVLAARVAEAAASRGVGDVEEHQRRAAQHRAAVLKAARQVDSAGRSIVDRAVLVELSALARRRTPVRESVYRLLVDPPVRPWTVAELFRELDGARPLRPDGIRDVLYVLLAEGALTTVRGSRALTAALTPPGEVALRSLLRSWGLSPV